MADADEDIIPRAHPAEGPSRDVADDYDSEDEIPDYRLLANVISKKNAGALPKRGEKDFEPNPTKSQASQLEASREAMRTALRAERVHFPRTTPIGQFLPSSEDWRYDRRTDQYGGGGRCVVVEKFNTTHGRTVGVQDWRSWVWLLPEEALFLLERGTLEVRWPDDEVEGLSKAHERHSTGHDSEHEARDGVKRGAPTGPPSHDEPQSDGTQNGSIARSHVVNASLRLGELPMSLQGAYASFVGKSGLSLERYVVYTNLKRLGYVVQRAPTWDDHDPLTNPATNGQHEVTLFGPPCSTSSPSSSGLVARLLAYLFKPNTEQYRPALGPLLNPGIYRSYNDIFRTLSLIPYATDVVKSKAGVEVTSTTSEPTPPVMRTTNAPLGPTAPFTISYHVWKPSAPWSKTAPGPPDFRVCVLDARSTSLPSMTQLSGLFATLPDDMLARDRRMEQRLKHGRRNVVLAVVDGGLVSYLRWCDMAFGELGKVFETKTARGTKGGGGRGRGRGRGRGGAPGGRGGGGAGRGGGGVGRSGGNGN